jgi:hypothetical protein
MIDAIPGLLGYNYKPLINRYLNNDGRFIGFFNLATKQANFHERTTAAILSQKIPPRHPNLSRNCPVYDINLTNYWAGGFFGVKIENFYPKKIKQWGCIISRSEEIVSDNYLVARRLRRFTQIFLWKISCFHLRKSAQSAGK